MIKPPIPTNEYRRLETLRSLKLLDTAPEERFDRVTRLARRVFDVPIALVSLVDADRQWFKSRQGLDVAETPREISFCGHAIVNDRIFVVDDAARDERFCDNPLVTCDPNIRFYAGYPISAPDGSRVGTLCIIDRKPRTMSKEDRGLLRELGRMVEEELLTADMSTSDATTGLSNRLGFSLIAEHLLATCRRMEQPVSLLAFRLTNLAQVDDSLGHREGDRAVVELAHLLMASFRESDVVGRLSMDTLGVVLAGANLDGADRARERLNALLIDRNNAERGDSYELELQQGAIAYHPGRHPEVEDLIREVEERLDEPQLDAAPALAEGA